MYRLRGEVSRRGPRLGFPLQGFVVHKLDATAHHLHSPLLPQLAHGPGYRLPLSPDHGAELPVGVGSVYPDSAPI